MANKEIVLRGGNPVVEYTVEFLQFVYVRTGFRFENFVAPAHLQRLLDELSFNRVPMRVWQGIMTGALRIANMSRTIQHGLREFGAFFIDVLVWLVRRLTQIGILKITIFLFNWTVSPLARIVITIIYNAIDWFLGPLWRDLSEFIQSRLITAPYYNHFIALQ